MVKEGKGDPPVDFNSVDEVIEFAIGQEIKAAELYRKFAALAQHPGIKKMCTEVAEEEGGHKDVFEKEYADNILDQN